MFALEYLHDPGGPRDGVTMTVPLIALNQVERRALRLAGAGAREGQGPAAREIAAAKGAPSARPARRLRRAVRRRRAAGRRCRSRRRSRATPARARNLAVPLDAFPPGDAARAHSSMNFRVVDEHGRQLAMGRSLRAAPCRARREGGRAVRAKSPARRRPDRAHRLVVRRAAGDHGGEARARRCWSAIRRSSIAASAVDLEVFDSPEKAGEAHRAGLRRLFMLQLREQAKYIEKGLPGLQAMALQSRRLDDADELKWQLVAAAFERACMAEPLPRNVDEFARRRDEGAEPRRADRAGARAARRDDPGGAPGAREEAARGEVVSERGARHRSAARAPDAPATSSARRRGSGCSISRVISRQRACGSTSCAPIRRAMRARRPRSRRSRPSGSARKRASARAAHRPAARAVPLAARGAARAARSRRS